MGKREENRTARRQQALAAARSIIAEDGVEALSMRRLAAACGLAVNTLYALFESREGVLAAVIGDGIERTAAEAVGRGARSPLAEARALVETGVRQRVAEAAYTKPMYRALAAAGSQQEAGRRHATPVLRGILARAVAEGLLREDVDLALLTDHVLSVFVGAATRWAFDELDAKEYEALARYGLALALAAAATPTAMPELHGELHDAERRLRAARRSRAGARRGTATGRDEPRQGPPKGSRSEA